MRRTLILFVLLLGRCKRLHLFLCACVPSQSPRPGSMNACACVRMHARRCVYLHARLYAHFPARMHMAHAVLVHGLS